MQSLASIKSTAEELTKTTTNSENSEVKLLAKLVSDLSDICEEVDSKAKQAYAETRRLKSELRKIERGS